MIDINEIASPNVVTEIGLRYLSTQYPDIMVVNVKAALRPRKQRPDVETGIENVFRRWGSRIVSINPTLLEADRSDINATMISKFWRMGNSLGEVASGVFSLSTFIRFLVPNVAREPEI